MDEDLEKSKLVENEFYTHTIAGTKVCFPVKPYGSQIIMMEKILRSLKDRKNCLAESPTGSGKTLALLSSTLAWQEMERIRILNNTSHNVDTVSKSEAPNTCFLHTDSFSNSQKQNVEHVNPTDYSNVASCSKTGEQQKTQSKKSKGIIYIDDDDSDFEDFKPSKKVCLQNENTCTPVKTGILLSKPSFISIKGTNFSPYKQFFVSSPSLVSFTDKGDIMCSPVIVDNSILPNTNSPNVEIPIDKGPVLTESKLNNPNIQAKHNKSCETDKKRPHVEMQINKRPILTSNPSIQVKPNKSCETDKKMPHVEMQNQLNELSKLPKIYFGTRTHKQVAQIVRELNKTAYKDVPLCILSSRERTCINHSVRNSPNINESCQELLDTQNGAACTYYHKANRITHGTVAYEMNNTAYDIEDLVKIGHRHGSCPYFASRNLLKDARLVIAPYNYITDPAIRSSMDISLKNAIIILDEAHNLEDVARDSASISLSLDAMTILVKDLEDFATHRQEWQDDSLEITRIFSGLCAFVKSNEDNLNDYREFDKGYKVWSGKDLNAILHNVKANEESSRKIYKFINDIQEEKGKLKEMQSFNPKMFKFPSPTSLFTLKQFSILLSFFFSNNMGYVNDYKAVISKGVSTKKGSSGSSWLSKKSMAWEFVLNIWCLNPAVAFSKISREFHTLIVASGTLSPMGSFESELSISFPFKIQTNHVIKKEQLWVGTIGKGPSGNPIRALYQNMQRYEFQDEIGSVVLEVCKVVPYGVLCFFSSYSAANKLYNRWLETGLLEKIQRHKLVVLEPNGIGSKDKFTEVMENFRGAIDNGEGALFLAVCRGKVSEGIDFPDNYARAVITIGIPFPNFKDVSVDLKKKYNTVQNYTDSSILSGNDWYETQAFRALNQALGRCIRHVNDWGALIIVDERFQCFPKYRKYLSKWITSNISDYQDFGNAMTSLKQFSDRNASNEGCLADSYFSQSNCSISEDFD